MRARRFLIAVVGVVALGGSAPAAFDRSVGRVHARPGQGSSGTRGRDQLARTRCVGVEHVAGAIVFGDRAVEMTMVDHSRWRMTFDAACPALSFYGGFYYRRAIAGRLCAGRDAVMARSGSNCPIASIARIGR